VNDLIKVPQVRLIDDEGGQVGVVATTDAKRIAAERGYDLVEVSPDSKPPVCRIMDYGKYAYEQQKKAKQAKKKQHVVQLKEIRFRPKIEGHDYDFKLKHIIGFLEQGFKVKVLVLFRGRELAHKELGTRIIDKLREDLEEIGKFDGPEKMEARTLSIVVLPLGGTKTKKKDSKEIT